MAKAPASDSIMEGAKMKPLLALSKREPVQAAFGLTADGEAVLMLDKKAKPRKVMSMLKASAGKSKLQMNSATLRFGRAEVDPDYDPSMVRFFVNKEAPGNMRVRLVEVLKKASFQKCEINVDPSLEEEDEEGETQDHEAQSTAPSTPPPPPPPVPPPTGVDEAALRHRLAELIGKIPAVAGSDANRKATLMKVAGLANEQFKAHHFEALNATLTKLSEVLDAGPVATGPKADPERWTAARAAWQDAIEAVDSQISALQRALRETGDEELEEIAQYGLNAVTNNHKVPVMAAVMEIGSGSAESLAKSGPKALAAVQAFKKHIESDQRVAACDQNPLGAAVAIRATLGPALAKLEAALTPA
jgi:hypothetical protein